MVKRHEAFNSQGRNGGGVGFSERMADSHGLWFGANGALETRAGSSIAIDGPSSFSGSWVTVCAHAIQQRGAEPI